MVKLLNFLFIAGLFFSLILSSCSDTEDPGPLQEIEKEFALIDFDRLEMGSAFNIKVEQASTFSIKVKGDQRNIDDLDVYKSGSTLVIRFNDHANRKHTTYITITMPYLKGVNFSGASVSVVKNFESTDNLDLILSGASTSQFDVSYKEVNINLSGASKLVIRGSGDELNGDVSGASELSAFDFPVKYSNINVSGASHARVTVSDVFDVIATGASDVLYRGNPSVNANVSGGSRVQKD